MKYEITIKFAKLAKPLAYMAVFVLRPLFGFELAKKIGAWVYMRGAKVVS